ncbi:MAG TPA: L,D-transpeptidase family protein [Ferruginibacter sp.]|nr:L,D-transpeptidase family protein [Ferruginibacter sp.]
MLKRFTKNYLFTTIAIMAISTAMAQTSFTSTQHYAVRIPYPVTPIIDTLQKQFAAKNLRFPPVEMYVRSFKLDRKLEVWVKDSAKGTYKLFKTYKVCMESGVLGPKRIEGDYQVPEGFYYINEFNPNSNYHLALGLNYPNASDKILSDSLHPGGDIYIHGNRVSTGCIPIDDEPIEEVYVLASIVKANGEDFIPVHVFPVKYDEKKSFDYLARVSLHDQQMQQFSITLKEVFDYFQENKQIPVIMVDKNGHYIID